MCYACYAFKPTNIFFYLQNFYYISIYKEKLYIVTNNIVGVHIYFTLKFQRTLALHFSALKCVTSVTPENTGSSFKLSKIITRQSKHPVLAGFM